ncbi:MAG: T9SS type A sorting domain-containing protein [Chitinophagales bacterium]
MTKITSPQIIHYLGFVFCCCLIPKNSSYAQTVILGPFIGEESLPPDNELICNIPIYPEVDVDLEGYTEGDLIPDFQLYDTNGEAYRASEILSDGKPALFISCNYTCPVFRNKIPDINNLKDLYGNALNIFLVYTVEAHPVIDISPYYGYVNTGSENLDAEILYRQPTTYGERKSLVENMINAEDISVPILIDGPCNTWWLNFGTNPNCAWLVDRNGVIYDAEQWLDRFPENIYSAIEGLLGITSDGEPVPRGIVSADADTNYVYGISGETIIIEASITNNDTVDAYLDLYRLSEDVPKNWTTSICTDICYSSNVSEATMYVNKGDTKVMHIYFYTSGNNASGSATIMLKNHYIPANTFTYTFKASTNVSEAPPDEKPTLFIYPNPATDYIQLQTYSTRKSDMYLTILDATGNTVYKEAFSKISGQFSTSINLENFAKGMYIIKVNISDFVLSDQFIIL